MNRIFLLLALSLAFLTTTVAQGNEDRLNYIAKYKDIAIREMNRAGIPASIKLAQGILESNSGKSYLARRGNNHFGMKCGSKAQWSGKTIYREDDDYDEQGKLQKSCFRAYKNGEASYIAHSEFLRDSRKAYRYGPLFKLDGQDYKRWARGLKQSGYATGANYDRKLIAIIETYDLDQYDREAAQVVSGKKKDKKKDKPERPTPVPDRPVIVGIQEINEVRLVVALAGETPAAASPVAADGKLPSAADGDLLTGTFYFLNKPPTLVRDGVLTPCAAVVTIAPGSLTYHGTRGPGQGQVDQDGENAYFSLPSSAVAINGVPCTAPDNVTLKVYYDSPGEPAIGVEGHTFKDFTCGVWGNVALQWFVVPVRRVAWLFFQKPGPDPSDWSCLESGLYECAMTRPLCRGGVLDLAGGRRAVD